MALDSSILLKSAGLAACIRQGFWKCTWHFPGKYTALRKLPATLVMLLLFLHSLDMFILVRFLPLLHLIILYGLLDFNLYVFMSFLYYRYLLLYLFISVFILLIFIYF